MMRHPERLLTALMFSLLAAFALILSTYKPFYNWDVVAYVAAAKSYEETDIKSLQSFTYDQLQHSVPDANYALLTQGSYGSVVSSDPSAFKEMLPFYQIRPVYTAFIFLFYKAGVNITFATHIIPAIAVVIALVFLYILSVSYLEKPFIYAVPPLALFFGVLDLARFSTPDGLAFLAVILCAYLYLKKHITLLLILLPIALGIRMDLILFAMPLLFSIFVFEGTKRWKPILSAVTSVAIYIAIGSYWKGAGWSTFIYALVHKPTHPLSMPSIPTLQDYFYALFLGTGNLINNKPFILYVVLVGFWLYLIKNQEKAASMVSVLKSPFVTLGIVCLVFVVSHFIAFPVGEDRYFDAAYLLTAFLLLVKLTSYWKAAHPAQQSSASDGDASSLQPL
jgi:hypothetical protein